MSTLYLHYLGHTFSQVIKNSRIIFYITIDCKKKKKKPPWFYPQGWTLHYSLLGRFTSEKLQFKMIKCNDILRGDIGSFWGEGKQAAEGELGSPDREMTAKRGLKDE